MLWLCIVTISILSHSDLRSNLRPRIFGILKIALGPRSIGVWVTYFVWILLLVKIADWVGIWRTILMRDTIVWSVTAGIALLLTSTDVSDPDYFRQALTRIASLTVVFEYFVNLATFHILIEFFVIQPIAFLVVLPPELLDEPERRTTWHRIRFAIAAILIISVLSRTIQALYLSWQSIEVELLVVRGTWPILLGIWVLIFIFLFSAVAKYEQKHC